MSSALPSINFHSLFTRRKVDLQDGARFWQATRRVPKKAHLGEPLFENFVNYRNWNDPFLIFVYLTGEDFVPADIAFHRMQATWSIQEKLSTSSTVYVSGRRRITSRKTSFILMLNDDRDLMMIKLFGIKPDRIYVNEKEKRRRKRAAQRLARRDKVFAVAVRRNLQIRDLGLLTLNTNHHGLGGVWLQDGEADSSVGAERG